MNHSYFISQAISLAARGAPAAYPNPLVGCVIVHNGEVVASGYHEKFGGHHAEVHAIIDLPQIYKPAECTLYVTLEPCNHYGKTPPCTDLIISKGFKKVVIGAGDPNASAGGGVEKLRAAGIEVITGVLQDEVKKQNARFFTFHQKKRPYFILKWAQTADGFISRWPVPQNRIENQISGHQANVFIHELRASVNGIMVGKNTVLSDNPQLTVRHVKGKNPTRIILDKNLDTSHDLNIYNQEAPTLILNAVREDEESEFIRYVKLDFAEGALNQICERLHELKIQSVMVEGGAILLESFIKKELWDEIIVIENPALQFGNGIKAPEIELKNLEKTLGADSIYRFFSH